MKGQKTANVLCAFQYIGLGYAGPLSIKTNSETALEAYILLFTCASSCALHPELTSDMKILAFIRAFERNTMSQGTPDGITNDNFKIFRSSNVVSWC